MAILPQRNAFNKRHSHWLAVASEVFAPALRLTARLAVPAPVSPPTTWRRMLIVGDTHIGDVLYRTPSLAPLKLGLPNCEIHYLASGMEAELLHGNSAITNVLPWRTTDYLLDLSAEQQEKLRAMKFDAMLCTNAVRGWPELLLALRLGIPNRVAYGHRGLSGWITFPIQAIHPQSFPGYFRDMVAGLTGRPPDWELRPVVNVSAEDTTEAETFWQELGYHSDERVVACFVTSRQLGVVFPPEWFGRALHLLQAQTGCRLVLCGAKTDQQELETLRQNFRLRAELNAGHLKLRALIPFLKRCCVTFCQDSGARHLSNAAGIPVVFVRNLRVNAVETGVYCHTEIDLIPPRIERVPPSHQNEVIAQITPESAVTVLKRILA